MDGLPPRAWAIPPQNRRLSADGVRAYIEQELSLEEHNTLWCWLHNLQLKEEAIERLASEAQDFLNS